MDSIRSLYETHGVTCYYKHHGNDYTNPHKTHIQTLLCGLNCDNFKTGIDFACGDGLVSQTLPDVKWVGVDPYLGSRYHILTSNDFMVSSMEEVAVGSCVLPKVDVVVCSYCFDIFEKSYLNSFLWQLSLISNTLIIIRGNKKKLASNWWNLTDFVINGKSCMTIYGVAHNNIM
jgi:hypothetical protein